MLEEAGVMEGSSMNRVFIATSLFFVLAAVGCAGGSSTNTPIPAASRSAIGLPHAVGRMQLASAPITTSGGAACGGSVSVSVSVLCFGPSGSKATIDFSVGQLGPFGLPPMRCSGVMWEATSQTYAPTAGLARGRAPRALGGPYYCDTSTSSSLSVTASESVGAVTIAHAYGTYTVCFDLPINPCAPSAVAGPTISIVTTAPSSGGGGGGGGSSGGGGGGSGGGGSCGASVQRAPAALRRPFTGVIGGGGGGSPSPSPAPTAAPTLMPSPSPAPCAPSPMPSANWTEIPVDEQERIEPSSVRRISQVLESCIGHLSIENQDDRPVRYHHEVACADPSAVVRHVELEFLSWRTSAKDGAPQYDKVEADCPTPGPRCNLPSIPLHLPLGHSQWVRICASYNGVMYHGGAAAYAQSNQECSDKFVMNRLAVRYPRIAPPVGVPLLEVPFPDAPFRDCTGQKGAGGCAERITSSAFRALILDAYPKQGWSAPPNVTRTFGAGYEAHHIKPLQWGGQNVGSNGILVLRADHLKLNTWWRNFDVGN